MFDGEVLVVEAAAVDRDAAGAVAINEVATWRKENQLMMTSIIIKSIPKNQPKMAQRA